MEIFEKWIARECITPFYELKEVMVMEQLVNVVEKEIIPLL